LNSANTFRSVTSVTLLSFPNTAPPIKPSLPCSRPSMSSKRFFRLASFFRSKSSPTMATDLTWVKQNLAETEKLSGGAAKRPFPFPHGLSSASYATRPRRAWDTASPEERLSADNGGKIFLVFGAGPSESVISAAPGPDTHLHLRSAGMVFWLQRTYVLRVVAFWLSVATSSRVTDSCSGCHAS